MDWFKGKLWPPKGHDIDKISLWVNALKVSRFKTIFEYNFIVFKITSQLKSCGKTINGEDIMEKQFTYFHALNMIFQ